LSVMSACAWASGKTQAASSHLAARPVNAPLS
jgi:hypothetical protein